jgi:hypothetical protein
MQEENQEKIHYIDKVFRLPIDYNEKKQTIQKHIIDDLELSESSDEKKQSMYELLFKSNSIFSKQMVPKFSQTYTTDVEFLKETQHLLKNYTPSNKDKPNCEEIYEIWYDIKSDTGFKDRYNYIDWTFWEFLNTSEPFLQFMSLYNIASPIISLFIPLIILIIPFFIIQMQGLKVTFNEYSQILKFLASNHAIGRIFFQFNSVSLEQKIYILVSTFFYLFSIYQNILSCIRFHTNMRKIHSCLFSILDYLNYSIDDMKHFLSLTEKLSTYNCFNKSLNQNIEILSSFREKIKTIGSYKWNLGKMWELGYILKTFYEVYSNTLYESALSYSFGYHGYIENIEGLIQNITAGNMNQVVFLEKTKKCKFKNSYYPFLINDNPVKNDINIDKNLIITGPNASGKTTILKTSLLNVILCQQFGYGCFDSGELCPFTHIHCYLNIPDTSGRDSLFQAEARRCKEIIDCVNHKPDDTHFCVFDEMYSGTNPDEATISAIAFMKYLVKFKNVTCLLTTHFIKVCKKLDTVKNIKNRCMHVITTLNGNFEYTYLLKDGISNIKGGMKVLSDMNYPKEILETTKKYTSG